MDMMNIGTDINIKDVIYVLLKKLWIMIIAGVIIGVSLGIYKIENRAKTYDVLDISKKLNVSETDIQYQLRLENVNKARAYTEMIDRVNVQIDSQRNYVSNSIYMQINPDNEFQSTAQIAITLNNNDVDGIDKSLFVAYENVIKSGNFLDDYAKAIDVNPEFLYELISFYNVSSEKAVLYADSDFNSQGTIYISVIGPSREFCDDLMGRIIEEINSNYTLFNSTITSHKLSVIAVQQVVRIDDNLRNVQNSQSNRVDALQKQLLNYYDSLDKIAKDLGLSDKSVIIDYFNSHDEISVNGIPTEISEQDVSRSTMIKPGIKYASVGFVLGVFLVAAVVIIKYFFGKRFITQAQFFSDFTAVRKIGVMKPNKKRSKYSVFMDIKSGDDTVLNSENSIKLISYNYENLTRSFDKILITGVGNHEIMSEAITSLGIRGDFKPDMFDNPEIIKSLHEYDGVVLIEERNSSVIRNIESEIELITNSGTNIIGAIII